MLRDIIVLHGGMLILPFLNYPDILVYMRCNKAMNRIYIMYNRPMSFYGLCLPEENNKMFHSLFYQRYELLEEELAMNSDVVSSFFDIDGRGTLHVKYAVYNYLTLMEIAYMLRDPIAIALLKNYGRIPGHTMYSYECAYGQHAHALLVEYSEHEIKDQIRRDYTNIIKTQNYGFHLRRAKQAKLI
jgi:hypothetical protein